MRQVIFDVETKLTFDQVGGYYPEKLGISFVGVIEREGLPENDPASETVHQFFEKDLDKLWPILQMADVVVGFNSDGFDLPTLKEYYPGDLKKLPSLDLMSRIKDSINRRISLDALAEQTLGTQKIGSGLDAIKYYQEQDWDNLAKYCIKDVEITRDLYDYGRQQGHVKYKNRWNNIVTSEVDFSFTTTPKAGVQMSLV